jgi:hypothetical protein
MREITLTCSLADQNFERTKSIGILNLSVGLCRALLRSGEFARPAVLANHSLDSFLQLPPGTRIGYFDGASRGGLARIFWDQWGCYSAAKATSNEWLFLPKGFASFLRKPPGRLAVYMHDAMQDFYATHFPGTIPRLEQLYFNRAAAASLRHADIIFTNTEFTRSEVNRLARKLNLPEPCSVLAGIGFEATSAPGGNKSERVVVLAGAWPHKRGDLAIEWTERWRVASSFGGEIHCVGRLPKAVAVPPHKAWKCHQRLSAAEYGALMQTARVLVYFSEYEGFGMPPVEATLAGACPVFSRLAATTEVMGTAGMPFSNNDFESFRRAMDQALRVAPAAMAAWRDELLQRHNWGRVAGQVVNAMATAGPSLSSGRQADRPPSSCPHRPSISPDR